MLETLDYSIRIGSTPTFLYFDLYLYSAYAAHCVYSGMCLFLIGSLRSTRRVTNAYGSSIDFLHTTYGRTCGMRAYFY